MSSFTTPFIGKLVGKNLWEVYENFEYHVGDYPSAKIINVPKGFITNFATVPRILWPIIAPIDDHGKAAVLHDYLYNIKYDDNRKTCDLIFKEALQVLNVNPIKVFLMYNVVRLFGRYRWNVPREDNLNHETK